AGAAIRASLGFENTTPVVLYTGTFEHYQGLDLLYGAMARVVAARPDARLVLVGGDAAQVDAARREVERLGLAGKVVFTGQRPAEGGPGALEAGPQLASPRH